MKLIKFEKTEKKTTKFQAKKKMGGSIMKCLYRELDRRKKYLIAKLQNEIATLEWQWFQREISDKEYCVQFDDIQRRIRELQG